jgi:hypothetical protein
MPNLCAVCKTNNANDMTKVVCDACSGNLTLSQDPKYDKALIQQSLLKSIGK